MGFLALIPTRYWIYAGISAVLLISGYIFVHKCHAAEADLQSIIVQSKADLVVANDKIASDATDHTAQLAADKVVYDEEHKANAVQYAIDLEHLRVLEAYRKAHPDVARTPAGPSGSPTGSGGPSKSDLSFNGLGDVAARLADGLRDTVTALDTCTRERDSLNGKP